MNIYIYIYYSNNAIPMMNPSNWCLALG